MELLVALVARSSAVNDIQAGEVITIQADGWGWSPAELSNPNWGIISSEISAANVTSLMSPFVPVGGNVAGTLYPRKANLLNLSAWFAGGVRSAPIITVGGASVAAAISLVAGQ